MQAVTCWQVLLCFFSSEGRPCFAQLYSGVALLVKEGLVWGDEEYLDSCHHKCTTIARQIATEIGISSVKPTFDIKHEARTKPDHPHIQNRSETTLSSSQTQPVGAKPLSTLLTIRLSRLTLCIPESHLSSMSNRPILYPARPTLPPQPQSHLRQHHGNLRQPRCTQKL